MQYRRAGCQSADVTLSVAPRAYRSVVKDPAVWDIAKPTTHAAPAKALSAERAGLERNEPPPLRAADAAEGQRVKRRPSTRRHRISRRLADGGAVIKEKMLLTKRLSEPQTRQKNWRPLHPQDGAPARKRGGRGGEKHGSGLPPPLRTPHERLQSARKTDLRRDSVLF